MHKKRKQTEICFRLLHLFVQPEVNGGAAGLTGIVGGDPSGDLRLIGVIDQQEMGVVFRQTVQVGLRYHPDGAGAEDIAGQNIHM